MNKVTFISPQAGTLHLMLGQGEYVLGRDMDVEIHIEDHSISRHHARVTIGEHQVWIEDLGSANGSFVNDLSTDGMVRLESGQTAKFGEVSMVIHRLGPEQALVHSDPYEIGGQVAAGGMGAIHAARQNAMGRDVAMKVMLKHGDARATQRFIHEARITGRLEHPNIVPVHEIGTDASGRVFYTMKYVRGTTLSTVIAELASGAPGAFHRHSLASLLTIFQKVCDAIAFAHSRGVIHRDLKPDNIMLGDFGEVLVMDWGLAKDLTTEIETTEDSGNIVSGGHGSTLDGSVMGTPAYMSPEQARGEIREMDARSDIYALGAILHEMLYLRPVVSGDSPLDVVAKVARGDRDRLGKFTSNHLPAARAPISLRAVRRKALAYSPVDRYQTVGELQSDITAYQAGFATGAEGAGIATQFSLFVKRHKGVARAVGSAAVLLIALTLWFTAHLVHARYRAEQERIAAEKAKIAAVEALALVEPARIEATAQRDKATAALRETESQRTIASTERDRAVKALASTQAIRRRATDALKQMQNADEIFSKLSVEYGRSGRVDEALENIDRALKVAPSNTQYLVARANLLQASGRFSQAIPEYRRALAARPDPQVALNLALTEKLLKEQGDAEELTKSVRDQLEDAFKAQRRMLEIVLLNGEDEEDPFAQSAVDEDSNDNAETSDPAAVKEELEKTKTESDDKTKTESDAEPKPESKPELDAETKALLDQLTDYTDQPNWNPGRIRKLEDGTFHLDLSRLRYSKLGELHGSKVSELNLFGTSISSLSDLKGLELRWLDLGQTKITDLGPIEKMPLVHLSLWNSSVQDLKPLKGMKINFLQMDHTKVKSLDPLRGMPIKELYFMPYPVEDYSPIESLLELEILSLPWEAHGIDFSKHAKLQQVHHPRFKHHGAMPAQEFIQLSKLSDEAWRKWERKIKTLNANDIRPHRLTITSPPDFDLDLRGSNVAHLKPLSGMPIHRIYLDSQDSKLDLSPLCKISSIRHLSLEDSKILNLRSCFPGSKLESITLNRSIDPSEIPLLFKHPTLQHLGYNNDPYTRLPSTTRDEFFHPRIQTKDEALPENLKPLLEYRFDDFSQPPTGWSMMEEDVEKIAASWFTDPPKHGGRGGGHLSFVKRVEADPKIRYFDAPPMLHGDKRALYGGCFEFQLRQNHAGAYFEDADFVLSAGKNKLIYRFKNRPVGCWTDFNIPIHPDAGWLVDKLDGRAAKQQDFMNVLSKIKGVQIRANYSKIKQIVWDTEVCDIDELRVWSATDASKRIQLAAEKMKRFEALIAWGKSLEIQSMDTGRYANELQYQYRQVDGVTWLESLKGREGVLFIHPVDQNTPATITLPIKQKLAKGSKLKLGVVTRGMSENSGVNIRVLCGNELIADVEIGMQWKDLEIPLPHLPDGESNSQIKIEINAQTRIREYCFFSEISLISDLEAQN